MAYIADLAQCDYFGAAEGRLLAVGWLDGEQLVTSGPRVTAEFFHSLVEMATDPWQPFVMAGRHPCPLCLYTGGPATIQLGDRSVVVGANNLFIPADEAVYVAPSLVLHYIDAHAYVPPEQFQLALKACPPMRSREYLELILRHRVNRLGRDRSPA